MLIPSISSVEFTVRHLGLAKVRGRFSEFSGHLEVGNDLGDTAVLAEVALSSVDTNNADRDAHLAGTDFFGVEANPTMDFASTGIVETSRGYELQGNLTIGETSRPVGFAIEFHGREVLSARWHHACGVLGGGEDLAPRVRHRIRHSAWCR